MNEGKILLNAIYLKLNRLFFQNIGLRTRREEVVNALYGNVQEHFVDQQPDVCARKFRGGENMYLVFKNIFLFYSSSSYRFTITLR